MDARPLVRLKIQPPDILAPAELSVGVIRVDIFGGGQAGQNYHNNPCPRYHDPFFMYHFSPFFSMNVK
jgi:hypothetical protein